MRILSLIFILSSFQALAQFDPTFGYFGVGRVGGNQYLKIADAGVDLQNPYRMDYTIEGHYMTDDIYYIGKIFNSLWGEYNYDDPSVGSYQVRNGVAVGFSLGAFETLNEHLGIGYGLRSDFGFYGISNIGGGRAENFNFLLGPEVPVSYQLNEFIRFYGRAAIMNVWNNEVFNGFATDFNLDLHLIPTNFLLVGGGVGFNNVRSNREYQNEVQTFYEYALYYRFYIGISLRSTRNY